jgi:hypothetical protein
MKYAFLFGSNVFIIPSNVISYVDNDETNEFLKIKSFCNDGERSHLRIDTNLKDIEGRGLRIHDNEVVSSFGYNVSQTADRILATGIDNSTVIDIQQLDEVTSLELEQSILAELQAHAPDAVIRIRGDFMMGKMHVEVDNDKLSVGRDSYASSAVAGGNGLKFTPSGLVV